MYPDPEPSALLCRVRRSTFPDGSVELSARFMVLEYRPVGGSSWLTKPREDRAQLNRINAERRARRELRWALMSIGADRLLTVTYRENMTDLKRARADWQQFIRLVRAKYPNWEYAAVLELQKRGAIHYHAGVKGWQDVNFLRACWLRVVGEAGGNVDVALHKRRFGSEGESFSIRRLASYLGKYLSKAFEWMPKGSRRFIASKDRPRPVVDRWWLEVGNAKGETLEVLYRSACGYRGIGVGQWLSMCGDWYSAWSDGPPGREDCPF